jgi:hypothetical protein
MWGSIRSLRLSHVYRFPWIAPRLAVMPEREGGFGCGCFPGGVGCRYDEVIEVSFVDRSHGLLSSRTDFA